MAVRLPVCDQKGHHLDWFLNSYDAMLKEWYYGQKHGTGKVSYEIYFGVKLITIDTGKAGFIEFENTEQAIEFILRWT